MNYVIWSIEHDAWWRPAKWGYTTVLAEAGVYSEAEARQIVQRANIRSFNECMIPVAVLVGADLVCSRMPAPAGEL